MLLRSYVRIGLLISLAALGACHSNPAGPTGDTTPRKLAITPDSATVHIGNTVTFTVSPGPAPFPKPFTITWRIDATQFVQTSVDTLAYTFTTLGKHTISATYTDSTEVKRDSAKTIVTVDTASGPPTTSGLGAFKIVVNGDTLDRAGYPNYCGAQIQFYLSGGRYFFAIDFSYSRTQFAGVDAINISFSGFVTAPIVTTYPIVNFNSAAGFDADLDSSTTQFASLDGGTLAITKFDTVRNLVSGWFQFTAAKRLPTADPSMIDTIVCSFTDVGIRNTQFDQGNMTADANGTPFQPIDKGALNLAGFINPGETILQIVGDQSAGSSLNEIGIRINTPQVGTFPFGDNKTPGTVTCNYIVGTTSYTTFGETNCGTLTITAYDPINHRISGTFNVTPWIYNTTTIATITNGVIDNVVWVQE